MTISYLLIHTSLKKIPEVRKKLKKIGGVLEIYALLNEYDILAKVDYSNILREEDFIRKLEEINGIIKIERLKVETGS